MTTTIRQDIRDEYTRLMVSERPIDRVNSYEVLINSAFKIIADLKEHSFTTIINHDADLLFQMSVLKCHSILKLIEGINYTNPIDNTAFKHTLDPFAIWPIVRSQYEAYCAFNNLFLQHSGEPQKILYNLWVVSGLNYRQQFEVISPDLIEKSQRERENIQTTIDEIKSTELYKSFLDKEKDKIVRAIKNKEWQFCFTNNRFEYLSWKNMVQRAGVKPSFFDSTYSYLSLCTHPTNVSVFQFKEMYMDGEHYSTSLFALLMSRMITAFLIRDYCTLLPIALDSFNKLPITSQILINSLNRAFRSPEFALNNIEESV